MPVDAYLGDIMMFAGSFEPKDWMICDGRLLSIGQYDALFNLIGTTYGGDGEQTFALPDLRGRVPLGAGTGTGLTPRTLGSPVGNETVGLTGGQVPLHQHLIQCYSGTATSPNPEQMVPANAEAGSLAYFSSQPGAGDALSSLAVTSVGSGVPHMNTQPSAVVNYCICVVGVFPPQA